jgi:hypothetical protein
MYMSEQSTSDNVIKVNTADFSKQSRPRKLAKCCNYTYTKGQKKNQVCGRACMKMYSIDDSEPVPRCGWHNPVKMLMAGVNARASANRQKS